MNKKFLFIFCYVATFSIHCNMMSVCHIVLNITLLTYLLALILNTVHFPSSSRLRYGQDGSTSRPACYFNMFCLLNHD